MYDFGPQILLAENTTGGEDLGKTTLISIFQ